MNAHLENEGTGLTEWQKSRLIDNEDALVVHIRGQLKALCAVDANQCDFVDVDVEGPESWTSLPPSSSEAADASQSETNDENSGLDPKARPPRRQLRFATIDPFVQPIESQIAFVGHTTLLAGLHGGALGLSLFLPPGRAAIFEIHTTTTGVNFHFHNMAKMMGHRYASTVVGNEVDVGATWEMMRMLVVTQLVSGR